MDFFVRLRTEITFASLSIIFITINLYIGANGLCHLLKREIGENPMLSRNCKWGVYTICHYSHTMGRRIDDEPKPGYLPILIFTSTTRMGIVIQVKSRFFTMRNLLETRGFFYALFQFVTQYIIHGS